MKNKLKYRDNSYFNSEDLYLFDNGLNKWYLTKVHFYNGFWYSDVACRYKMSSVVCVNCEELYDLSVSFLGAKGNIKKFLENPNNDFGIMWEGLNENKNLNYYWYDVNLFRNGIN